MMSQTLDVREKISNVQTSQNPIKGKKTEVAFRVGSSCSCPQCDSIDCFKIRHENANLLCTCNSCKQTSSRKNILYKKSSSPKVSKRKVKEDEPNHLLHTNTNICVEKKLSDKSNFEVIQKIVKDEHKDPFSTGIKDKESDDKIYLELPKKDDKEVEQRDVLNAKTKRDMENKKNEDKISLEITEEVIPEVEIKPDMENKNCDDKLYRTVIKKVKEYQQKKELKTQRKKSDDKSNHEKPLKVVKEDKQKDSLQTNHYFVTKIFKEETFYENNRKFVKEDRQKCPLVINNKYNHLNKKNDDITSCETKNCGNRHERKDTPNTQNNNKYDFVYKKSQDNPENARKVAEESLQEVTQDIKQNKIDYSNKKSKDEKCSEKAEKDGAHDHTDILNTCTSHLHHKKSDDTSYCEMTRRKVVKEHEYKDTLNKHIKSEHSKVHIEFIYKDMTFTKDNVKKSEASHEKITRNYSVANTRKEEETEPENPTAKLSAQIMDLSYQDYKDSLSLHKPANTVNTNKITKQDFLAKLKEIYKACSCKVCECIPGFSTNDVNKGDTCYCEDIKYTHSQSNSHNSHEFTQLPHSGCACYRCDRKDCQGVWKNKMGTATCDCEPCDCVKFTKSFTKPCDCEPCQCVKCTSLNFPMSRPVIVAPVQEYFQQNLCQCEPCECVHCTHNYGAMASNLMRDVSTGTASHRNCNCETCANNSCQIDDADCRYNTQNRIVKKPIDRSAHDYDLRRALIGENSFNEKRSDKIKNVDNIIMFTFLNEPNTIFKKSEDGCNCMDCECIFCEDKEKYSSGIKNSYEEVIDQSLSTCKCQPCECLICCKDEKAESDIMKATRDLNNCGCDICDCITCKGLSYYYQNKEMNDRIKSIFKNKSVEITVENTKDFNNKMSTDFVYQLKKGKVLTPSMFEAKILSQTQSQLPILTKPLPSTSTLKVNGKNSNKKLACLQNITICHSKSVNKYFDINANNQSRNHKLIPTYFNDFEIDTDPRQSSTIENNAITNQHAQKSIHNIESSSKNFFFPKKSSVICVDKSKNETLNYNKNNMQIKLLNNHRTSKRKINSNEDLVRSRIIGFEKSILQIQEDISQHRKALAEICSINGMSHENFYENNTEISFYDEASEKSLSAVLETNKIDSSEFIKFYKEPDKIKYSENQNIEEINNNSDILIDYNCHGLKYDQNDSFSKGDSKTCTRFIKRPHVNVNKLRNRVAKSKIKKLTRNRENITIDFISDHLKNSYKHHGNSKLIRKLSIKSASTSHNNCSVPELQSFNHDNGHSQTEIHKGDTKLWSILRKNFSINHTPVSDKEICTFPELELNIKRAMQSISSQTNEIRGYAALSKVELELKSIHSDGSSQTHQQTLLVDKELNCNIGQSMEEMNVDMKKLVDLILTRTKCQSELTKPFSIIPERPEVQKINSVRSSCDGLKATFLCVRRVSDHTVLLRWRAPRQVENVQGYELQVDGRPVQKILSPARCTAVLTCLPHCEKLLLTVRTLTSVPPPAHYPAATLVYYPREKRARYPRPKFAELPAYRD